MSCSELLGAARSCSELLGAARSCSELLGAARNCSELLGAGVPVLARGEGGLTTRGKGRRLVNILD